MFSRVNPGFRSKTKVDETSDMMLTRDPQNFTEIPSLFQTFRQQDNGVGGDEESEIMADTPHRSGHAELSPFASASGRDLSKASSASVYPQRGGGFLVAAPLWGNRTGQGLTSNSRSQHLNRSSHNPYKLLSSSDVHQQVQETGPVANSAKSAHQHRTNYSLSGNGLKTPLIVDSPSTSTVHEISSSNVASNGVVRRPPSEQHQSMDAPSTGFWRDGNPMALSANDIRHVPITIVGTLTSGDKEQNLNVNVKQRLRPGVNSSTCSLSTSSMAMPVVQPASSPQTSSLMGARNASNVIESTSQLSLGSIPHVPRFHSGGCPPSVERSSTGLSSKQPTRSPIATVAKPTKVLGDHELASWGNVNSAEVAPHAASHNFSERLPCQPSQQQQQQQPQQQQQQQQHQPLQQEKFSHALQIQSYNPQQQQHHGAYDNAGYMSQNYYLRAPQRGTYVQEPSLSKERKRQHYAPHASNSDMPTPQVAAGVGNGQNCAKESPTPKMQPGNPPSIASNGVTVSHYGTPSIIPPQSQHTDVVRESLPDEQSTTRQQNSTSAAAQAPVCQASKVVKPPHSTKGATTAANGKSMEVKAQRAKLTQQQQAEKVPTPEPASTLSAPSKTRAKSPSSATSTSTTTKSPGWSSAKLTKKKNEARFLVDHSAPVRVFVVVRRKKEGQRYASSMAAEDLPVGSYILVEGDRGADLGQVMGHVSIDQMAHDCVIVERMRQHAMLRMLYRKTLNIRNVNDDVDRLDFDETNVPQLMGQTALEYIMSLKTWPRVIGPTTPEDRASLVPQRDAEMQAFAIAKPIVQQFIENRYLQRVARHEEALAAAAAAAATPKTTGPKAAVTKVAAEKSADQSSTEDGERSVNPTSLSEEELKNLQLSREVTLVDCEYQFTREKITLYVSRPSRSIFLDFRSMQRKLFRTFRCRIWIAYMDEVTEDKDAPDSFVFVPSPSTYSIAASTRNNRKNAKQAV